MCLICVVDNRQILAIVLLLLRGIVGGSEVIDCSSGNPCLTFSLNETGKSSNGYTLSVQTSFAGVSGTDFCVCIS